MRQSNNLVSIIWQTPLLRRVLIVALLGAVILPGYELLTVYPSFEALLSKSIEKEASRTAHHLLHVLSGTMQHDVNFNRETFDKTDWDRLQRSASDFGLWKTRVFSSDGEIIFSTIAKEVGQHNKHDYFFTIVAKGQSFSKLEHKQGKSMEGVVLPLDVVEVYVPVMQEGQFLGAIEVYYNITDESTLLQSLLLKSGLIFIGLTVFIVLLLVLLLIKTAKESRELAQTQKNLNTQEKIFHDVINSAHDGIMVTNAEQQIKIVNPAFCALSGYGEHEVLEKTPAILRSSLHDSDFYTQMWQAINEHKHWRGEIWVQRKDGSDIPELLNISTIEDEMDGVTHYVGIYTDISQQKAAEQHYQDMAYHDPLTGLPNRLLFLDRAKQSIRESERSGEQVAVLFLDLDGFKQVNDSGGHDAGDLLLQEVAHRLSSSVRREDTVARMGGDEFTVILRNIPARDMLEQIGNKLLHAINEPVSVGDETFHVGASIGISCFPEDAEDIETLVAAADEAMYEAKQSGKNRIVMRCDPLHKKTETLV